MKIAYLNAQGERVEAELLADNGLTMLLLMLDNGVVIEMLSDLSASHAVVLYRADGGRLEAAKHPSGDVLVAATDTPTLAA